MKPDKVMSAEDAAGLVGDGATVGLVGGERRLEEIVPGIDPRRDVLERMAFQPIVNDHLDTMPEACFPS